MRIGSSIRLACLASALFAGGAVFAQGGETSQSGKPDVVIRVERALPGVQYVYVQVVRKDYPPQLLSEQCQAVGAALNQDIRGLELSTSAIAMGSSDYGSPGTMSILRARFAINGLVDESAGVLRLVPFAKAFAGAEEPHTVRNLMILYVGYEPVKDSTLSSVETDVVKVTGRVDYASMSDGSLKPMVEYRVELKTQDPAQLEFPEAASKPTKPAENPSTGTVDWRLLGIVLAAALPVGLLVYFALRPRRGRRTASRRHEKR